MSDDIMEQIRSFLKQDFDRGASPFVKAAVIGSDLSNKRGSAFIAHWDDNGETQRAEIAVNADTMRDVFMVMAGFIVAQEQYGDDPDFKARVTEKTDELCQQAEAAVAKRSGQEH